MVEWRVRGRRAVNGEEARLLLALEPAGAEYFFVPCDDSDADPAKFGLVTDQGAPAMRTMRKLVLLLIFAALSGLATTSDAPALRSGTRSLGRTTVVKISTRRLPKLGTVLVNGKGLTLYLFVPDKRKKVTCLHTCAVVWPPVKLAKGHKAVAAGKAKAALLGSDPDPAGGRVVTYNKWPLYTYVADKKPGQATGQALNLNGGLWYVVGPSGNVIKTKP